MSLKIFQLIASTYLSEVFPAKFNNLYQLPYKYFEVEDYLVYTTILLFLLSKSIGSNLNFCILLLSCFNRKFKVNFKRHSCFLSFDFFE